MAKKKLNIKSKVKLSDWEIVDDLPKAQDGKNTSNNKSLINLNLNKGSEEQPQISGYNWNDKRGGVNGFGFNFNPSKNASFNAGLITVPIGVPGKEFIHLPNFGFNYDVNKNINLGMQVSPMEPAPLKAKLRLKFQKGGLIKAQNGGRAPIEGTPQQYQTYQDSSFLHNLSAGKTFNERDRAIRLALNADLRPNQLNKHESWVDKTPDAAQDAKEDIKGYKGSKITISKTKTPLAKGYDNNILKEGKPFLKSDSKFLRIKPQGYENRKQYNSGYTNQATAYETATGLYTDPNTYNIEDETDKAAIKKIYPELTDADITNEVTDEIRYINNNKLGYIKRGTHITDGSRYPNRSIWWDEEMGGTGIRPEAIQNMIGSTYESLPYYPAPVQPIIPPAPPTPPTPLPHVDWYTRERQAGEKGSALYDKTGKKYSLIDKYDKKTNKLIETYDPTKISAPQNVEQATVQNRNGGLIKAQNGRLFTNPSQQGYTGAGALTYKGLQGLGAKPILQQQKNGGNVNTDWEFVQDDNEWEVMEEGDVTQKGYKRNSPYVNNKQNIINSGRITMKGVDFPVHGVDEFGNEQMMFPNGEYSFPGNQVTETRMKKNGRCLECEQKSLIKAQDGITVDDNIQKFNELQRQISDIRNIRSKAVDKAKEVVKSGKYYELPKSALNFEQTQGKQEETCINGVCGVYNDVGVKFDQPGTVEGRFIGNGTFRNINPKTGNPNYYDAGFRPIYNRDEMQVGDLVAWGKGHMQIMTDKDADGFKSFDNYNKAERAYKWGELSNPVVYGEKKTYREPLGFRYSKNENELQQQRDSLKKEIQKDNPHFLDNTFVPKYGDYKQLNTVNYTPTEGNTLSIKKANAEKWLSSILPDQKKYMQDYNLSQSEFEKIAKLYSGILEQESDLGTSPRYFAKKIPLMQLFGKELTDLKDIYKGKKPTYSLSDMIFNENYSQGVGQIKPKWFKEDNKYGINIDDPRAAFITLLDRYKNQVHENKGTEEGYRQLVNAYKGIKSPNNEYLKNVFDYANKVNFNSDLVAPKFDYEGSKKKNQMPVRRGQYVESPIMANGGEISKWEVIN